ncbi:DNA-directed RNA polymerase III subunit RPC9 isoform X2 [Lagopus leucura]|uniref:DNA-directed RNA polymerase III subunit RPC9 isoform X2 n=2 Tax=Tetraoninae TaxID=466585 RepID=UPI001C665268|nr:DNA-directed RNA polymerase III subunit RPC9 isoform X2 [Lagopus leucura]
MLSKNKRGRAANSQILKHRGAAAAPGCRAVGTMDSGRLREPLPRQPVERRETVGTKCSSLLTFLFIAVCQQELRWRNRAVKARFCSPSLGAQPAAVNGRGAEGQCWELSAWMGKRKDANAALLSNFEVFQLLTDLKQQRKESGKSKQSSGQQNLNTIMYETLKYISKTPCRYQSPETVKEFLAAMKGHKLTKAEKLQLLNHRPVTAVEIQLMVEESEERLTEEQIESLLQTVASILPGDPEEQQRDSAMETEGRGGQ